MQLLLPQKGHGTLKIKAETEAIGKRRMACGFHSLSFVIFSNITQTKLKSPGTRIPEGDIFVRGL